MIFDKITNTYQRIEDIKEKILVLELQVSSPKSGEITGMPRDGGNASNPFDSYLERKEKLEGKLDVLNDRFKSQWKQALHLMRLADIKRQTRYMMYLRFYKGLSWKKCNAIMQEKYPNGKWNENKIFREYRNTLIKVRRVRRLNECS